MESFRLATYSVITEHGIISFSSYFSEKYIILFGYIVLRSSWVLYQPHVSRPVIKMWIGTASSGDAHSFACRTNPLKLQLQPLYHYSINDQVLSMHSTCSSDTQIRFVFFRI